jgi:histidinol dehydrogenase
MIKVYSVQKAREKILRRDFFSTTISEGQQENPELVVRKIVKDIRKRGDQAVREWTLKLDKADIDEFEVLNIDFEKALDNVDPKLRNALEVAVDRIFRFHKSQPIMSWMNFDLGGELGQIVKPIGRVGIYIPGGSAPLFSSILMTAIPAIVAGTKELILASPPNKTGKLSDGILATCGIIKQLGANFRLFRIGGAQAIAAMAFGTNQVPKVDKIVGPGNIYVTLAKREVFGVVGIDGLYGPTEALIIADDTANPSLIVADLLAQAEHDPRAIPIVITHSQTLVDSLKKDYELQIMNLERNSIIQESIENNGGIIFSQSTNQSIEISNEFAPEHLTLMVEDPMAFLNKIENAGGIFIGESSFEVLGDYIAGPSHVMPTSGTARYSSALSVNDFIKRISYINFDKKSALKLSQYAEEIAKAESLTGHANAAKLRRLNSKYEKERDIYD